MDFQDARSVGYYFDRCIDLYFYSTDGRFLGVLKTPKNGFKPTITIKGTLIPNDYSVNNIITVQNMTYDIDIASIGSIGVHIYYSGINESIVHSEVIDELKKGNNIIYKVLYFDQDKTPPNRCVRFKCVIASQDTARFETPIYVSGSSFQYGTDEPRKMNLNDKMTNAITSLKTVGIEIANVYNKGLGLEKFKALKLKDEIGITAIEIDKSIEHLQVTLPKEETLGDFIRELNSQEDEDGNNLFKIVIVTGKVQITRPLPKNWRAQAKSKGQTEKQYIDEWLKDGMSVYFLDKGQGKSFRTINQPIPLNYVRYATRAENNISIETMFDARIKPECYVKINAKAVMGKKRGTSGSRLINYGGEVITCKVTAGIEYLFSTTEDSYMRLTAVVVGETDTGSK